MSDPRPWSLRAILAVAHRSQASTKCRKSDLEAQTRFCASGAEFCEQLDGAESPTPRSASTKGVRRRRFRAFVCDRVSDCTR